MSKRHAYDMRMNPRNFYLFENSDNTDIAYVEVEVMGLLYYFAKQYADVHPVVCKISCKLAYALLAAETEAAPVLCST